MVKKSKILIIEDELDLRELYVELLTSAGYEVDFATDGQQGADKLQEGGWDLILLDIIMPKVDGMTVLQILQKNPPKKPNGPIILLTALSQDSLIHQGLTSGASGYLIKSEITPDKVLEEVSNFLKK